MTEELLTPERLAQAAPFHMRTYNLDAPTNLAPNAEAMTIEVTLSSSTVLPSGVDVTDAVVLDFATVGLAEELVRRLRRTANDRVEGGTEA